MVRTPFGDSKSVSVKVGVHQGSVLSPLLFIMVMEAIMKYTRKGLPWELLYTDDLMLITESQKELIDRLRNWKQCLEKKDLKVNVAKTNVLISTGELIRGNRELGLVECVEREWEIIRFSVLYVRNGCMGDAQELRVGWLSKMDRLCARDVRAGTEIRRDFLQMIKMELWRLE